MSYTERMENKEEYKFILGENSITKSLSAEEVLKLELDPDVHVKLIRKYEISFLSQIPFEIFQQFIEYIVENIIPCINEQNVLGFYMLSQEVCKDSIKQFYLDKFQEVFSS